MPSPHPASPPVGARQPVGWYAHHSGAGHVTRAVLVAASMSTPVTILSSAPRPAHWPADRWVDLPDDAAPGGIDHTAGGALHWAPTGHAGYRDRMATLAQWIGTHRPPLLVVDVSVEVTLLARLLGVPTAVTLMAGDRTDRPHQLAYDAASALVAAWPPLAGEAPVTGLREQWRERTTYAGAFSRFDHLTPGPPPGGRHVTVLWGSGRSPGTRARLLAAQQATPGWHWSSCEGLGADEVWARLQSADVVVTHAGQNALAEVAASTRPAVVLPQPRPHDEQHRLARSLASLGIVGVERDWPADAQWPGLLEARRTSPPTPWSRWSDRQGAQRLADHLDALAARCAA
ncbi:glycosyltransferase [Dermatophilaceae bacterium Soc4.6]